ncbi:VOC family protein [Streptomyces sp. NPDC048664]|uniref:VOC family protein n=1 Tax=Streptomyces sp. NPDC048664 TaxID=3154505 RepID=UPI00341A5599
MAVRPREGRLRPAARPGAADEGPGLWVRALDHLVLTVADVERTVAFCSRVLGMRPVTFGEGRRALAFGASKINLHPAGGELLPRAARPTTGSADLCLVTSQAQRQISSTTSRPAAWPSRRAPYRAPARSARSPVPTCATPTGI